MIESFYLWEQEKLNSAGFEATRNNFSGFVQGVMINSGNINIDIKNVGLKSNGLPLLPLKSVGALEEFLHRCSPTDHFKANIHLAKMGRLSLGYLSSPGEQSKLEIRDEILLINEHETEPLNKYELQALRSLGLFGEDEKIVPAYDDAVGNSAIGAIDARASSLWMRSSKNFPFPTIAFRDYFAF